MAKKKEEKIVSNGDAALVQALTNKYNVLKDRIKEHDEIISKAKEELLGVEKSLDDLFNGMGIINLKNEHGTYFKASDFFANYKKEDIEKVHKWMKKMKAGALIKPSIHHKSFSGFIAEIRENNIMAGKKADEGIPKFISMHKVPRIRFRKAT